MSDEAGSQRADKWLWCARFQKHRSDCAALIVSGALRINRQPTDKPHARVRVGDVLTVAIGSQIRVVAVLALAERRGPPQEASLLYRDVPDGVGEAAPTGDGGCGTARSAAYAASVPPVRSD